MKKIISIVIILLVLLIGTVSLYAADNSSNNIELNLRGASTIKPDTKTLELILSLGTFTGITEKKALGYIATLNYDTNMFSGAKIEALNGWNVEYSSTNKKIVGDVENANANADIAKIILTLRSDIVADQTGTVSLNNIELTDGTNDFTYNKEGTITVERNLGEGNQAVQASSEETVVNSDSGDYTAEEIIDNNLENSLVEDASESNNINEDTDETVSEDEDGDTEKIIEDEYIIAEEMQDNTAANQKMPATGIQSIILITIGITVVAMGIFKFKSRKIK